jgi:YD repeat-containing protein
VITRGHFGEVESLEVNGLTEPWRAEFTRDVRGAEIERRLPGDVVAQWERDLRGQPIAHAVFRNGQPVESVRYRWKAGDRLVAKTDPEGRGTTYDHDGSSRLLAARSDEGTVQFRVPDSAGNVYRRPDCSDRAYGPGGRLDVVDGATCRYDGDGRCVERRLADGATWSYRYDGAGRLAEVGRPDGASVSFRYDALGRRISKQGPDGATRWVWDRAVPLHELSSQGPMTTWIFEPDSFAPLGMISGRDRYGIVTDHLGAPRLGER